jgi:hypothetical protein
MRCVAPSLAFLGAIALSFLGSGPAVAQATRTWVSGVGDDANPCSRTAPCKTFAGAISKTHINGEINCIDPGGFGAVTITKSITIDCWHVGGSILASSTTGIIVNIPVGNLNDPHRSVRIRGLAINGTGAIGTTGTRTGIDGVRVLQARNVSIEKTAIHEFSQQAIEVATGANLDLVLDDMRISNCNVSGIKLAATAGAIIASLNDVRVHFCPVGLDAASRTRIHVQNSLFTQGSVGIQTTGVENAINADDITVSRTTVALIATPGSSIRISDSTITSNGTGINANGGLIISMQMNNVTNNSIDGSFSSTITKR